MNKKLLALAIGAAVAMPVAALADGPTLYGKLNVSLENQDDGTDDAWVVRDNSSRLGVKGSAETGVSGLTGIYLAEFGLEVDGQAASDDAANDVITQRNIYAGLSGGFGTVLAGNVDTPTKTAQGKVDQFNDTSADIENYMAGELRAPNIVAYVSPKLADAITITAALWQGEGAEGAGSTGAGTDPLTGIGDAVSASVVYEKDSLYLALALDMETPVTGGVAVAADNYNDIVRAVAGYTTDSFEVGFMYQTAEGADEGSSNEDTTMLLSGAYKTGDWKFKAQLAETEGDTGAGTNTVSFMGLGADYALGKATTVGAFYAAAEDDFTQDDSVISFGLEQRF